MTIKRFLVTLVCVTTLSAAQPAHAFIKFWVGARGDLFAVSGELFQQTEDVLAFGGELGVGISFFELYFEALMMEAETALFTANLGVGFDFGDRVAFQVGGYTGPMMFLYPEATSTSGVDFSGLSSNTTTALEEAFGSISEAEAEFDSYAEDEEDLGRLALGWNIVRARAGLDFGIAGPLHLGLAGQLGYHVLISGDEIAAGAKTEAIDNYASEYGLTDSITDELRSAVGAEEVDTDSLNGFNYDVYVYLRLQFGG